MKSTNILLPEALWEEAQILAIRKRISFTALVRQALRDCLDGQHVDVITIDEHGGIHPPEATQLLRRHEDR
jgi:predicted transcriptional regulator